MKKLAFQFALSVILLPPLLWLFSHIPDCSYLWSVHWFLVFLAGVTIIDVIVFVIKSRRKSRYTLKVTKLDKQD